MKFAIVFAALVAVASAQFGFTSTPRPFQYRPNSYPTAPPPPPRPIPNRVGDESQAKILRYENDIGPDGSYIFTYETENGIFAQEQGTPRNFGGNPPVVPDVVQGSFSFTAPEGDQISIKYIADENGYQPQGSAIPTPHPIPEAILKALDFIARNAPQKN